VKPPRFEYVDPNTIDEALGLLKEYGDDAKILAGGQSFVPILNFRLARPRYVVDLNRIDGLAYITERDGGLAVGAMTRQRAVERSPIVAKRCPLLHEAMPLIGHFQIRNRGTIGGSLAHADPSAELPAVVTALGATLIVRGAGAERVVRPEDFFVSYLTTSLEAGELLSEIRFPARAPRSGHAFLEISRRHGDFALVGVAATVTCDADGTCTGATLALTGVAPVPLRADSAERALVGVRPEADAIAEAARRVSEALNPDSDIHASADYRKHVAGILTSRALRQAIARVQGEEREDGAER
jgi:CO/xanthine dehydrogenase FAD-binding subunit